MSDFVDDPDMGRGTKRKRPGGPRRKWKTGMHELPLDSEVFFEVNEIFQKWYSYPSIPEEEVVYPKCENQIDLTWQDSELKELKEELNYTKSELSDFDINKWHRHTSGMHPGGTIINHIRHNMGAELCTQAWCKFREVLGMFGLPDGLDDGLSSVHLCEAPGGFVCSLNHYLRDLGFDKPWTWRAQTLNPYYEGNCIMKMIDDDQFIFNTQDLWHFGSDNCGDVMQSRTATELAEVTKGSPVQLVTADGSFDCANTPAEQEVMTSHLHFCEIVTALHVLAPGGHLVLKMFTMFERSTIELMLLLCSAFRHVNVFKPVTSKPGNSEVYVVAKSYRAVPNDLLATLKTFMDKKHIDSLYNTEDIPDSFLTAHRACSKLFTEWQMDTIEENLDLYEYPEPAVITQLRRGCLKEFMRRHVVEPLDPEKRIVPLEPQQQGQQPVKRAKLNNPKRYEGFRHDGTYDHRMRQLDSRWADQVDDMDLLELDADGMAPWLQDSESITEEEIAEWKPVLGKAFDRVHSSRFCSKNLLHQYHEMLDHARCLAEETTEYSTFLEDSAQLIVNKLKEASDGVFSPSDDSSPNILQTAIQNILKTTVISSETEAESSRISPKLVCMDTYKASMDEILWSMCTDCVQILQKLQTFSPGDALVMTAPPILTRINAGLMFCLQNIFNKVTIIAPAEMSLPVSFVVAVGYRAPLPALATYLDPVVEKILNKENKADAPQQSTEVGSEAPTDQPEMEVLAFVPINQLYEQNFNDALSKANTTIIKSRLNYLISAEKKHYADIEDETVYISE